MSPSELREKLTRFAPTGTRDRSLMDEATDYAVKLVTLGPDADAIIEDACAIRDAYIAGATRRR